jgi:hypothetical protein
MVFALGSISSSPHAFAALSHSSLAFPVTRHQLSYGHAQRCHYHMTSFIGKILDNLKIRQLSEPQLTQAAVDQEKLRIAHFSIGNHAQANDHWDKLCDLQVALFQRKGYENYMQCCSDGSSVYRFYSSLLTKRKEELSTEEIQKLIKLYQFALVPPSHDDSPSDFDVLQALYQKHQKYELLLSQKEDPGN